MKTTLLIIVSTLLIGSVGATEPVRDSTGVKQDKVYLIYFNNSSIPDTIRVKPENMNQTWNDGQRGDRMIVNK